MESQGLKSDQMFSGEKNFFSIFLAEKASKIFKTFFQFYTKSFENS